MGILTCRPEVARWETVVTRAVSAGTIREDGLVVSACRALTSFVETWRTIVFRRVATRPGKLVVIVL